MKCYPKFVAPVRVIHISQQGFTLIELLITIAIIGVLMGIALPNYRTYVQNNCITGASSKLIASFFVARSEAIKRRASVTVTSASGIAWEDGWAVTWNEDLNGNLVLDAGEDFDGSGGLNTITTLTATLTCPVSIVGDFTAITYTPSGLSDGTRGDLDICDESVQRSATYNGRTISISATGRATASDGLCVIP